METIEFNATAAKPPLTVTIVGLGRLDPQKDITPLESVQLSMLLVALSVNAGADYVGFARQHGLKRHFA